MRRMVVAVVVAAVLVSLPACGGRTDEASRAAGITPRNAVAFVSVSLDPSIAQKKNMLDIARKFPKARDKVRKSFQETRDGLLADAVKEACLDYQRDVKPWLGSELAVAALPRPSGGGVDGIVYIRVKDEGKARKALETAFATSCKGGTGHREFRIVDGFAVVSTSDQAADTTALLDSVEQQAKANDGGLAKTDAFRRVESKLHGDRLLLGYVDAKAALAAGGTEQTRSGCDPVAAFGSGGSAAFDVHVGSASVVLEGVGDRSSAPLKTGVPKLTRGLPSDTTGAFTLLDVAGIVRTALSCSGAKDEIQGQIADETGLDLEAEILSWMGGEAVVVAGPFRAGRSLPEFGVVVEPTDRQKAADAVDKLKAKLTEGGGSLQEFDVDGTKGSTVAHGSGRSGDTQPAMVLLPDRFILATSPDFVRALARSDGSGFGTSAAYRAVVGDGSGAGTEAQLVVSISAIKDAIVANLSAEDRQAYQKDVAPQVDPLDAFGIRVFDQDGLSHVELKVTLK